MHEMYTAVFPQKVKRDFVQAAMNRTALTKGEYHQPADPIKWKDTMKPFSSEEDAYNYIEDNFFGNYEAVAVPFIQVENIEKQVKGHPRLETSYRKIKEVKKKIQDINHECYKMDETLHFANAKANFIGCKNCGSKIAKKYLVNNFCPVCHKDMRPQSVLDKIAAKHKKQKELVKKAFFMEQELKKKLKGEIMWLVKIEYHV